MNLPAIPANFTADERVAWLLAIFAMSQFPNRERIWI
jgi:hypothetical protein